MSNIIRLIGQANNALNIESMHRIYNEQHEQISISCSPFSNDIYACTANEGLDLFQIKITIDKLFINLNFSKVESAKLLLYKKSQYGSSVEVNGVQTNLIDGRLEIDVKNNLQIENNNVIVIDNYSSDSIVFHTTGEYAPSLVIEYDNSIITQYTKDYELGPQTSLNANMLEGKYNLTINDVYDVQTGLNVSHVISDDGVVRTNLDERIEKVSEESEKLKYVDVYGFDHIFHYTYVYFNPLVNSYINLEERYVTILPNGKLVYIQGDNTYDVVKKEYTLDGLQVQTQLKGIKNLKDYDQRTNEEIELEERISTYKRTFCDHCEVNSNTGRIITPITNITSDAVIENLLKSNNYLLSKSEADVYKTLLISNKSYTIDTVEEYEEKAADILSQISILQRQLQQIRSESEKNKMAYIDSFLYYVTVDQSTKDINFYCINQNNLYNCSVLETTNDLILSKSDAATYKYYETNNSQTQEQTFYEREISESIYDKSLYNKDHLFDVMSSFTVINENGIVQGNMPSNPTFSDYIDLYYTTGYMIRKSELATYQSIVNQINSLLSTRQDLFTKIQIIQGTATNIDDKYTSFNEQIVKLNSDIASFSSKSNENKTTLSKYYNEYKKLKEQYKQLEMSLPVNYVTSNGIVKGFNKDGNLCVLYQKNGEYYVVEREIFFDSDNEEQYRVKNIKDKDGNIRIAIEYEKTSNRISSVKSASGNRVCFEYDASFNIQKICYSNGEYIEFSNEYKNINFSDNTGVRIRYVDFLREIEYVSNQNGISHDEILPSNGLHNSKIVFSYEILNVLVSNDTDGREKYTFELDGNLKILLEEKNHKVVKANSNEYFYQATGLYQRIESKEAKLDILNESTIELFNFNSYYLDVSNFNLFGLLTSKTTSERPIYKTNSNKTTKSHAIYYKYDENDNVIEEKDVETTKCYLISGQTETLDSQEEITYITRYNYTVNGQLTKKESFVVGEEISEGINVTEYEYDENGNNVKTYSYNTKDTSSKFYEETTKDKNGKTIAELDDTGRFESKISYNSNGEEIRKTYPNESILAVGYDSKNGKTSVTSSTKDGEENSTRIEHTSSYPTKVCSMGNTFEYEYDFKGRITNIKINGNQYCTISYQDNVSYANRNCKSKSITYANGMTKSILTDYYDEVIDVIINESQTTKEIENDFDLRNRLYHHYNVSNKYRFVSTLTYDELDNVTEIQKHGYDVLDNNSIYEFVMDTYSFNGNGDISTESTFVCGETITRNYLYKDNSKKELERINITNDFLTNNTISVKPSYDCQGRITTKDILFQNNNILSRELTYVKYGDHTTNRPYSIKYGDNVITYRYNNMGRIESIYENNQFVCNYEYDLLGRLIRENNKKLNKTRVIDYDAKGNILSETEYSFTLSSQLEELEGTTKKYEYSANDDKLTKYGNETISYDSLGNPVSYRGNVTTYENFKLKTYGNNSFEYDAEGNRIRKNNYLYTYDNQGRLVYQSTTNVVDGTTGIRFIYDNEELIGFYHNNNLYFYVKDILGNISEIVDTSGTIKVKYTYDAWEIIQLKT